MRRVVRQLKMESSLVISFLIFGLLSFAEGLLSYKFVGWYFEFGIPLKVYTTKILYPLKQIPSQEDIQNSILKSEYVAIKVKKINENTFAFRESFPLNSNLKSNLNQSYSPVMRGNLCYDIQNEVVKVKALLNWSVILGFLLIILLGIILEPALAFIALILLLFSISSYFTQIERFEHVARMAASISKKDESVA